ncbi:hypothetical protein Ciccas_008895 [Cichlidogyrus casuarinus]|uniref:AMP-binding enzyme C-terminal domain-containing protein n=1 Tax=Cichlidogyrus casuarinus TaxID=1844966 RepID=A0ABD2PZI1_9PLAT
MQDDLGFFYFRDRLGDTFRWRGENVSTNEVEAVVMSGLELQCCVVYGVEVPGCEGKAGMLAMALNPADFVNEAASKVKLDEKGCNELMAKLLKIVQDQLPPYAHPLFVRLVEKIDTTGTFKLRKVDLVKQSFDPETDPSDVIFYFDAKTRSYQRLTRQIFQDIHSGKVRF